MHCYFYLYINANTGILTSEKSSVFQMAVMIDGLLGHSIENFYEPSVYQRTYDIVRDKTIRLLRGLENALTPRWSF